MGLLLIRREVEGTASVSCAAEVGSTFGVGSEGRKTQRDVRGCFQFLIATRVIRGLKRAADGRGLARMNRKGWLASLAVLADGNGGGHRG